LLLTEKLEHSVFVNTVIDPSRCRLYTFPPEELSQIADSMEKQGRALTNRLRLNRQVWESAVNALRSNANEGQVEAICKIKEAAFEARRDGPEGTRSHVTAAWKLMDEGQYAEALEEVLRTPETHPHFYHSLALSGNSRRCLGDFERAEKDLSRALKMSPRRPEAFLFQAWLRINQNRLEESLEDAVNAREFIKAEDHLEGYVEEILQLLHSRQGNLVLEFIGSP
jgi:tetratricopeptide (TPR) repeat protein